MAALARGFIQVRKRELYTFQISLVILLASFLLLFLRPELLNDIKLLVGMVAVYWFGWAKGFGSYGQNDSDTRPRAGDRERGSKSD